MDGSRPSKYESKSDEIGVSVEELAIGVDQLSDGGVDFDKRRYRDLRKLLAVILWNSDKRTLDRLSIQIAATNASL